MIDTWEVLHNFGLEDVGEAGWQCKCMVSVVIFSDDPTQDLHHMLEQHNLSTIHYDLPLGQTWQYNIHHL